MPTLAKSLGSCPLLLLSFALIPHFIYISIYVCGWVCVSLKLSQTLSGKRQVLKNFEKTLYFSKASQVALVVKNLPANLGDLGDAGSTPVSGRSPGEGHGNLLRHSCLENPVDRGAWEITVHMVAKNRTWLKRLSTQAHKSLKPLHYRSQLQDVNSLHPPPNSCLLSVQN